MSDLMSDMHDELPPKAWKDMDAAERKEAARLLRLAASQAFRNMADELNSELKSRGCPLRVEGALVVTWPDEAKKAPGAP